MWEAISAQSQMLKALAEARLAQPASAPPVVQALIAAQRQLWLVQAHVLDRDKASLLNASVTPGHTFGPVVDELLLKSQKACKSTKELVRLLPRKAPQSSKQTATWHPRAQQPQTQRATVPAGWGAPHHSGGQTQRGHSCQFRRPPYAQKAMAKLQSAQQQPYGFSATGPGPLFREPTGLLPIKHHEHLDAHHNIVQLLAPVQTGPSLLFGSAYDFCLQPSRRPGGVPRGAYRTPLKCSLLINLEPQKIVHEM
ncbi:UNVERIFIED_CONTAM: hypothetical protein FKN15_042901 [Acipenser sinensis]